MDTSEVSRLLRSTELFAGLDEATAHDVAGSMVRRTYRKGQLLFNQGDPGGALFVVASGRLAVYLSSVDGDRVTLNTLGPTAVFGEIALLDEGNRSASVEALESTTVFALSRPVFLRLLAAQPDLVDKVLRGLGGLVRRLSEQAADFVFLDLPGRVAKALLRLAADGGGDAGREGRPDVGRSEVTVTQGQLAELAGGSRQSVNAILQSFAGRGLVELSGRRIVLLRIDLLQRRAGQRL